MSETNTNPEARAIIAALLAEEVGLRHDDRLADDIIAALAAEGKVIEDDWMPIDSAPKDGTPLLVLLRDDIYPNLKPGRDDLEPWNGLQVVMHHRGIPESGFDVGWSVAAPVGHGGFPDEWIAGWCPLPTPTLPPAGDDTP